MSSWVLSEGDDAADTAGSLNELVAQKVLPPTERSDTLENLVLQDQRFAPLIR